MILVYSLIGPPSISTIYLTLTLYQALAGTICWRAGNNTKKNKTVPVLKGAHWLVEEKRTKQSKYAPERKAKYKTSLK